MGWILGAIWAAFWVWLVLHIGQRRLNKKFMEQHLQQRDPKERESNYWW